MDSYLTHDLGEELFGWQPESFGLKAGKWKIPFSRSRAESGRRLQFADRSSSNIFFDLNRSLGVGLYGRVDTPSPIHFETAVFNGFLTGSVSTSRTAGLDDNIAWSGRIYSDLLGEFGNDGEPDLSWHEPLALRVGAAAARTRIERTGSTEFLRQRVVDSGQTLASLLPTTVDAYDVALYTVDAQLKYQGFSLIAEHYWRHIDNLQGGTIPSLTDSGFNFQSGYFLVPEKFELLIRWSRILGDSGSRGLFTASSDEIAGGCVWYLRGHNAKVTIDATHVNGVPVSSSRLDLLPGDAGWLLRTQFQLSF